MFGKTRRKKEEPYIGEVYIKYYGIYGLGSYWTWCKFHECDVDIYKSHDGFKNIFDKCHSEKNIFYYDQPYQFLKRKIEMRVIAENNEKVKK